MSAGQRTRAKSGGRWWAGGALPLTGRDDRYVLDRHGRLASRAVVVTNALFADHTNLNI